MVTSAPRYLTDLSFEETLHACVVLLPFPTAACAQRPLPS
jgi:hypothetical protein